MRGFSWVLLIILGMLAMYEYTGLRTQQAGDLISEQWWWVRDNLFWAGMTLFAGWSWLTWHFWFGRSGWYGWQDIAAIAAGAIIYVVRWRVMA